MYLQQNEQVMFGKMIERSRDLYMHSLLCTFSIAITSMCLSSHVILCNKATLISNRSIIMSLKMASVYMYLETVMWRDCNFQYLISNCSSVTARFYMFYWVPKRSILLIWLQDGHIITTIHA